MGVMVVLAAVPATQIAVKCNSSHYRVIRHRTRYENAQTQIVRPGGGFNTSCMTNMRWPCPVKWEWESGYNATAAVLLFPKLGLSPATPLAHQGQRPALSAFALPPPASAH